MSNQDKQARPMPMVLAVDDSPEILDIVRDLLLTKYQVRLAPNGTIALKIADAQQPDLILLDVVMPDLDGYEVCRRLKSNPDTAHIPVIFLTSQGETVDQAEGFKLGAADYILKPINPPLLEARVNTQISLKKTLDELKNTTEELRIAKSKMEDELNVGQRIQLSMLPTVPPSHKEFRVAATMRAARQVGGDLYDYFFVDPRRFCVCIADVSDKGVPASLFMAVTKTLIRARAADDHSTASIVTRINNELARDNEACMFVTMFLAILDLSNGVLTYTNAGHNLPYVKRQSGVVESITQLHGPVAGAVEGLAYKQSELTLFQGDQLFLYTDGVSEAMDHSDNLFTENRIAEVLTNCTNQTPDQVCQTVLKAVDDFVAGAEQSDDITLLSLHIDGQLASQAYCSFELELINQFSEIDRLNDAFNEFADSAGVDISIQLKLNMVFDELINNIISYGYKDNDRHTITVRAEINGDCLMVTVEDGGIPFNPFLLETPDVSSDIEDRQIGGLGIFLVKEVMDDVTYQRVQNSNRVTLLKHLNAEQS